MKTRVRAVNILFAMALLALVGFTIGAPNAGAATVGSPDTSTISAQVYHKLAMLPWYGVFDNLAYQVNGSEVILSGQVVSEHDQTKYDAEKCSKNNPRRD